MFHRWGRLLLRGTNIYLSYGGASELRVRFRVSKAGLCPPPLPPPPRPPPPPPPPVVFLRTVPRWFLCFSSSLFMRWWFRMCPFVFFLFVPHLSFFWCLGVWGGPQSCLFRDMLRLVSRTTRHSPDFQEQAIHRLVSRTTIHSPTFKNNKYCIYSKYREIRAKQTL